MSSALHCSVRFAFPVPAFFIATVPAICISWDRIHNYSACISWYVIHNILPVFPYKVFTHISPSWYSITVFRCLSPFKIGIHISLEQSVWANLSWNPFRKRIASICFGPNHSGKKFRGKIWIFEKVTLKISAEIGFFGLTWRVTLL